MSASPETVDDIQEGDILAGKYRVERILGTGGMGMVVAAHHIQLDERVALKFLLPAAIANMESVARFIREARSAFKIKSEHVARVTDVGQLENGSPYIVMEYLDGKDLAAWLIEYGAMPIPQAVDFVLQASEAIAEAHAIGIVHRDLKPANLFCVQRSDGQPSIKVLDFGISKVMNQTAQMHAMTRTNGLVGSPLYMSPEHMKSSKTVDARTDIWSLGIILYQLIAGHPPFEGEAVTELVLKVATEPPIPLRNFRPDAPEGLEKVLGKCLEKDRNKRYQTIGEMAVALAEFGPPHARASVDRVVGTLEMAGVSKVFKPGLAQSGTNPAMSVVPLPGAPEIAASRPDVPHVSSPHTLASWNEAAPLAKPSRRAAIGITAAIGVSAATVLAFLVYVNLRAAPSTETSWSAVSDTPSSTTTAPSVSPTAAPIVGAPPPATPLTPSAIAQEAAPLPPPTSSSNGVAPPSAPPPAVRHTTSGVRPGCAVPFTISSTGTKRYKPECM